MSDEQTARIAELEARVDVLTVENAKLRGEVAELRAFPRTMLAKVAAEARKINENMARYEAHLRDLEKL